MFSEGQAISRNFTDTGAVRNQRESGLLALAEQIMSEDDLRIDLLLGNLIGVTHLMEQFGLEGDPAVTISEALQLHEKLID